MTCHRIAATAWLADPEAVVQNPVNITMGSFLAHWVVTGVALIVADWVLAGVRVGNGLSLVIGALVLGLINALVRPLLVLLTLPFTVITLGLFYFVVNGMAFGLAAFLVPGFEVRSLWSAMGGALIVGLVSWALSAVFDRRRG